MSSRSVVNPLVSLAGDIAIIGAAVLLASNVGRGWSWPLFVWGFLLGPVAVAFAYFSTQAFDRSLAKAIPAQRCDIAAHMRDVRARYRVTYFGLLVVGCAVGVVAARTHGVPIDSVATILWVLSGVVPPIIAWPIIRRRALRGTRDVPR